MLLQLNYNLIIYIYNTFIDISDLVRLDTSLCSKINRSCLNIIYPKVCVNTKFIITKTITINIYDWFCKKNIYFDRIHLNGDNYDYNTLFTNYIISNQNIIKYLYIGSEIYQNGFDIIEKLIKIILQNNTNLYSVVFYTGNIKNYTSIISDELICIKYKIIHMLITNMLCTCDNIQHIHISSSFFPKELIIKLLRASLKLKSLNLISCDLIKFKFDLLKKIEYVYFEQCCNLITIELHSICLRSIIINKCNNLRNFKIKNLCLSLNKIIINNSNIMSLDLSLCPNLTCLMLDNSDYLIEIIIPKYSKLEIIRLKLCNFLLNCYLDNFLKIKSLKKISLSSNNILQIDFPTNSNLILIHLFDCINLLTINFDKCLKLKTLSISNCQSLKIDQSTKNLNKLKYIELYDSTITKLDMSNFLNLLILKICNCNQLNEINVFYCKYLHNLELFNCNNISKIDISSYSKLRYVIIDNAKIKFELTDGFCGENYFYVRKLI